MSDISPTWIQVIKRAQGIGPVIKGVVSVGIRDSWIRRLKCSKVSFSSFFSALSSGCSFSLKRIDFFHMTGATNPETDSSVTREKRSPSSQLCLGTLGKVLICTT